MGSVAPVRRAVDFFDRWPTPGVRRFALVDAFAFPTRFDCDFFVAAM